MLDGLGAISVGDLAHCWQRRVFPGGGARMLPTWRISGSGWKDSRLYMAHIFWGHGECPVTNP